MHIRCQLFMCLPVRLNQENEEIRPQPWPIIVVVVRVEFDCAHYNASSNSTMFKGGGTGGGLEEFHPMFDLRTQTLHADNQLLCSLSRQPPQSYFCSAATDYVVFCRKTWTWWELASFLHATQIGWNGHSASPAKQHWREGLLSTAKGIW